MSHSYNFCLNRVTSPDFSNFCELDWSEAEECTYEDWYVTKIPDGQYSYDEDNITFKFKYDANADFQYFTSIQFKHDGTLLFISKGIQELINRIYGAATYNKLIGAPKENSIASYVYGNPIILNEYGDFGTEDKPWLCERTTILIPIEYHLDDKE